MRRYTLLLSGALLLVLVVASVSASPPGQTSLLDVFAFDTRADLEVLADQVLGEAQRPEGWTFNTDITSATMISDLWFDNELLANAVFGSPQRPEEWIGATSYDAEIVARNVRHDLELMATQVYGIGTRPDNWRGAAPIVSCNRTLQNIVAMLGDFYDKRLTVPESALNYCATAAAEVESQLTEIGLAAGGLEAEFANLVLAVRGDLERLADQQYGHPDRPAGWTGNRDPASQTLIPDLFLDMQTLADTVFGVNERPAGWIGAITVTPVISYRNLRHDVEMLADEMVGAGQRPHGWQGGDPLTRCDPRVQDLVLLAAQNYSFASSADTAAPDYCKQVEDAANFAVENPPISDVVDEGDARFRGESQLAFSYLDVGATQFMGIMPPGIEFRAWYRNFGDSNMMFVSGEDFALYIDRRWTTLTQDKFDILPSLEGVVPRTFCEAGWCNGPGPTPTPTGSGAIIALLTQATPPAPPSQEEIANKIQVSWNHIRVTYLVDNAETRTVQVALEICAEPAQIACEPVVSVFDNALGSGKPVLSDFNGLNVYEFPYGYSSNLVIEGDTRFSPDIWISDPTIR